MIEPGEEVFLDTSYALALSARTDQFHAREVERPAEVAFGASGKRFHVLAQFTCKPAGHEVQLAHQGDATQEILQAYSDALVATTNLPVKRGARSRSKCDCR